MNEIKVNFCSRKEIYIYNKCMNQMNNNFFFNAHGNYKTKMTYDMNKFMFFGCIFLGWKKIVGGRWQVAGGS